MKSNYKRIGDYISLVDERNAGHNVKNLLGLSISKQFIPSVANIIGTDMENYKIIRKNQFACSTMQVRRDKKMPVALLQEMDEAIISQAYPIFEVKDEKELLPEYLMMWFARSEFDREACFYAVGGVRGSLEWEDFENMQLPIPHPDKQREIVKEYNTIQNRINLNNQLIQKLEETAQAIYKQWFVEGIDLENLPEGWKEKSFTEVGKLSGGGTPDTNNPLFWNGEIPFFTPADVSTSYYSIQTEKSITDVGLENSSTKLYPKNTVFITARGTVGALSIAGCEMAMNQSCYALTSKYQFFIHQLTRETMNKLKTEAVGAVFGALVTKDFNAQFVIEPPIELQKKFDNKVSKIYEYILLKTKENQKLTELKDLLLSKLATVDN
jgi:type I restriction enzyme S subunit